MTIEVNIEELAANANRGAELLDEVRPGWAIEIDLTTLDMASADYCVLGQLYGEYDDGLFELELTGNEQSENGFNSPDWANFTESCRVLTPLWKAQIATRLAE